MRRVILPLLVLLVAAASPLQRVAAAEQDGDVHDIVFPVVGDVTYSDTFGEPRGSGRTHEGQDLLGEKMQQLVAADAGVITMLTWPEASYGYYLRLTADDGWVYSYVHINNDAPGTDDGAAARGDVYGPGIEEGVRVERGQLLAYMGDSGNAEETAAHVHFEMHRPDGSVVNPMPALDAAQRVDAPTGEVDESPIPRLAGPDRVATAVAVSGRGWPDGSPSAIIASGDAYGEALPASVLAASRGAPLLLATGDGLPDAVSVELDRLGVTEVVVVGSVAPEVEDDLRREGRGVTRVGGPGDPVATAAAVSERVGGASGVAVLVNRSRFADGVSAAGLAAGGAWPILLTDTDLIPQVSVDAWRALGVTRIVLVGGTGVIGANIETFVQERGRCGASGGCDVERIAGTDRYETSVAAADRALAAGGRSLATMLLGTGTSYPDALASGPLAARLGGVSLLVDGSGLGTDDASMSFLAEHSTAIASVAILGGRGAVTSTADRAIQDALGLT